MEHRHSLGWGRTGGQPLKHVPKNRVTDGALVHWEIAFEHTAISVEQFDASLDIWAPQDCELL